MLRRFSPFTKDDVSFHCQACSLTIAVPCMHRNGTASVKFARTQTERGTAVTRKIVSALIPSHPVPSPGPLPQNLKVCRWLSPAVSSLYATDFAKLRCLHWSHVLVYRVYREERFRGVELDEFGWEPSNHGIAQMILTVGRFRFRIRLQQNNCALNFISHVLLLGAAVRWAFG